jgi:hypothetical protein
LILNEQLAEVVNLYFRATGELAEAEVISIDEEARRDNAFYDLVQRIDSQIGLYGDDTKLSSERKPEESHTGKDAVSVLILKTLVNCCPKCKGVASIGYYDDENHYKWRPCEKCKEARDWLDKQG